MALSMALVGGREPTETHAAATCPWNSSQASFRHVEVLRPITLPPKDIQKENPSQEQEDTIENMQLKESIILSTSIDFSTKKKESIITAPGAAGEWGRSAHLPGGACL